MAEDEELDDRRTVILLSRSKEPPHSVHVQMVVPEQTQAIEELAVADGSRWETFDAHTDIQVAGADVYRALTLPDDLRLRLEQLVSNASLPVHRLEFRFVGGEPDAILEALWPPGSSDPIALDERFEVMRTVRVTGRVENTVVVEGPIRWTGVLAASGTPGHPDEIEQELRSALEPLRNQKLEVAPRVLVATAEIKERVASVLRALGFAGFEVALVASDEAGVKAQLLGSPGEAPHIVHVYCHGVLDGVGGAPVLLIGNKASVLAPDGVEEPPLDTSVNPNGLFTSSFRNADLLLVVLNACDSGAAPPGRAPGGGPLGSIAHTLVAGGGVPFVIAHSRPLSAGESHRSTRSTYGRLALALRDFDGTDERTFLPRLIDGRNAMDDNRWVVPALWARDAPTMVDGRVVYALRVKLQALRSIEQAIGSTASAQLLAAVGKEIGATQLEIDGAAEKRALAVVAQERIEAVSRSVDREVETAPVAEAPEPARDSGDRIERLRRSLPPPRPPRGRRLRRAQRALGPGSAAAGDPAEPAREATEEGPAATQTGEHA